MIKSKKEIRAAFRKGVFERDAYKCVICKSPADDPHHITDRTLLPYGGYVLENGISLCSNCHFKAEMYHATGIPYTGFSPKDLYKSIGSCYKTAYLCSILIEQPESAYSHYLRILDSVDAAELAICIQLDGDISLSRETWELACDELGVVDPLVVNYWKGRYAEPY